MRSPSHPSLARQLAHRRHHLLDAGCKDAAAGRSHSLVQEHMVPAEQEGFDARTVGNGSVHASGIMQLHQHTGPCPSSLAAAYMAAH